MTCYKIINSPSWQSKKCLSLELLSSHLYPGCEVLEIDDLNNERLLGLVNRAMLITLCTEWIDRVLIDSRIAPDERISAAFKTVKEHIAGKDHTIQQLKNCSRNAQYALNRYYADGALWPVAKQKIIESLIGDLTYAITNPLQKRVVYNIGEISSIAKNPRKERIIQGKRILAYFKSSDYLFNLDKS